MAVPYPIKRLVPAIILAVYSSLVAFGFMELEREKHETYVLSEDGTENVTLAKFENCTSIETTDMWTAIFFVGTVFTTIGYGNVHPCTNGGKILTIFFSLTSIPIALVTLDNIGFLLARFFSWIWNKINRCMKRVRRIEPSKVGKNPVAERDKTLPLLIGVLILVLWIAFMVIFFFYLEEGHPGWDLTSTIYFVFVTITTVGFGDLSPSEDAMHFVILKLTMIMIGLALFSMCINLVLDSMAQMVQDIADQIIREHLESINNDTGHFRETNPAKVRTKIQKIMAKHPGGFFIRFFILRHTMDDLVKQYMSKGMLKPASTQVEEEDFEALEKLQEDLAAKEEESKDDQDNTHESENPDETRISLPETDENNLEKFSDENVSEIIQPSGANLGILRTRSAQLNA